MSPGRKHILPDDLTERQFFACCLVDGEDPIGWYFGGNATCTGSVTTYQVFAVNQTTGKKLTLVETEDRDLFYSLMAPYWIL
jgi:hypothetical protein